MRNSKLLRGYIFRTLKSNGPETTNVFEALLFQLLEIGLRTEQ